MLRILRAQIEQMQASRDNAFILATARFYRQQHPNLIKHIDDEQLGFRIAAGLKSARSLGIVESSGITQYVGLAILAGSGFLTDPTICAFLTHLGQTPDERLRDLLGRVMQKLRVAGEVTSTGSQE